MEAKRERALYFQYRRDMGSLFDILKSYVLLILSHELNLFLDFNHIDFR